MVTQESNRYLRSKVIDALREFAVAGAPRVAGMLDAKGITNYESSRRGNRSVKVFVKTEDASRVINAILDNWEVLRQYFPRNQEDVRAQVYYVRSVRNSFEGHNEGDSRYAYEALGAIERALEFLCLNKAARTVHDWKEELGRRRFGLPVAPPTTTGKTVDDAGADHIHGQLAEIIRATLREELAKLRVVGSPLIGLTPVADAGDPEPTSDVSIDGEESEDFDSGIEATTDAWDEATIARAFGVIHFEAGDYDTAIDSLTIAISLDPSSVGAYQLRGYVHQTMQNLDLAIKDYDVAVALGSTDPDIYRRRGDACALFGDLDAAIASYNEGMEFDLGPADKAKFLYKRGAAYYVNGEGKRAIDDFNAAIDSDPDFAGSYMGRAFVRLDKWEYTAAATDLDKCIEIDPGNANYHLSRAHLYLEVGQGAQALECYDTAIDLDASIASDCYYHRGIAHMQMEEFELAVVDFDVSIRLDPTNAGTYHMRGIANSVTGNYQQAVADIDRAAELAPDDASWSVIREAIINIFNNTFNEYDRAIADNPGDPVNWCLRGLHFLDHDYYHRAVDDFSQAIRLDPKMFEAWYNRGLAYARQEDSKQALENYNMAIGILPDRAEAYYSRALIWRREDNQPNALSDFDKAIELNPEYADAYLNRGVIHQSLGNHVEAQDDFRTARELGFDP